jgi:hypothetical protein
MYDVPSQPDQSRRMTTRRWVGWVAVCVLAAILALAIAFGLSNIIASAPAVELPLAFTLFALILNGVLWLLSLRGLGVPARWIASSLPGGVLAGALALVAGPDQLPAPWGAVLVLATLFIALCLGQWLALRRHLAQAGSLLLVEAGVFLVIYGGIIALLLDAVARLQ